MTPENTPYIIPRPIYNALGPLEQLAAQALEQCGKVKITDAGEEGE